MKGESKPNVSFEGLFEQGADSTNVELLHKSVQKLTDEGVIFTCANGEEVTPKKYLELIKNTMRKDSDGLASSPFPKDYFSSENVRKDLEAVSKVHKDNIKAEPTFNAAGEQKPTAKSYFGGNDPEQTIDRIQRHNNSIVQPGDVPIEAKDYFSPEKTRQDLAAVLNDHEDKSKS